jgi:serine/threonine protein kinase
MAFRPSIDQILEIKRRSYRVSPHPTARGVPYGQEGRQGIVYQLIAENGTHWALKVSRERFRTPQLLDLARRQQEYSKLQGLRVCERIILSAQTDTELCTTYPDLNYAVLMPWIEGDTWYDLIANAYPLSHHQSITIAHAFVRVLSTIEEYGLAHCDLSGPNIVWSPAGGAVELVDVEQMYEAHLTRPTLLPAGSSGYAHATAANGVWNIYGDRFAGAVLLAEMLGWCDSAVVNASYGEHFFAPDELQQPGQRFDLLSMRLGQLWGERVAQLFRQAWQSPTLQQAPMFGEWLLALPDPVPLATPIPVVDRRSEASTGSGAPYVTANAASPAQQAESSAAGRTVSNAHQRDGNGVWWFLGSILCLFFIVVFIQTIRSSQTDIPTVAGGPSLSTDPTQGVGGEAAQTPPGSPGFQASPASGASDVLSTGYVLPGTLYYSMQDGTTDYQIYSLSLTSQLPVQLTNTGSNYTPQIAPDGSRIAFTSERDGKEQVYVMNIHGANQQRISTMDGIAEYPSWSPDGQMLAYTHNEDAEATEAATGWRIVTQSPGATSSFRLSGEWGTWPRWSHQGIVFTTRESVEGGTQLDLEIIQPDGSQLRLLNRSQDRDEHYAQWSPDGGQIVYVSGPSNSVSRRQIWLMDADGTNRRQLTDGVGAVSTPTWSPDGQWIAFLARWDDSEVYNIWVVPAAGGQAMPLLTNQNRKFGLAWAW